MEETRPNSHIDPSASDKISDSGHVANAASVSGSAPTDASDTDTAGSRGTESSVSWVDDFPARKFGLPMLEGKTFREIFMESAMLFMSPEQIASLLGTDLADLSQRCIETFGMNAPTTCKNLASLADKDARMLMRTLSEMGNSTATGIYANYIARLARDEGERQNGIKVMVTVKAEDDD